MGAEEWSVDESLVKKVDEVLSEWRQGDVLRSPDISMLTLAHVEWPLTPAAAEAAERVGGEDGSDVVLVENEIEALVIVSQTCDVVETAATAPEIVLCPLYRIEDEHSAAEAAKGWIPRFAPVPGEGDDAFADLSRWTTVEKALAIEWERTQGLRSDKEIQGFQAITQLQIGRFALPDDWKPAFAPLRQRMRDKRNRESPEGRALRAIDEIRVLAFPNWEADEIEVDIYFLVNSREDWTAVATEAENADEEWEELRQIWQARCSPAGCIKSMNVIAIPIEELDARTYSDAAPLNLGGMSPQ